MLHNTTSCHMRLEASWAGQRSICDSVDVAVNMTDAAAHGVGGRRQLTTARSGRSANYPAVVRNVICITQGGCSQIKSAE